jgi:hypothetical protein
VKEGAGIKVRRLNYDESQSQVLNCTSAEGETFLKFQVYVHESGCPQTQFQVVCPPRQRCQVIYEK